MRSLPAIIPCLMIVTAARAAEVRFGINATETYVGRPVAFTIEIDNAQTSEPPEMPTIEGVLTAGPNRSTQSFTQIINGQFSQRETVVLTYHFIPQQTGPFTIPAITVTADGQQFTSQPYMVNVQKSETGDLMFAEVVAEDEAIYLGQPLRIALQIWVKEFNDRRLGVRLSAQNFWDLMGIHGDTWSAFTGRANQQPTGRNESSFTVQNVSRMDENGRESPYYLFEMATTIWPRKAGPLELPPTTVVMDYPTRVTRGTFGPSIAERRPISVAANAPQFIVREPPTEGRLPGFNGAVGQFDIAVAAQPIDVAVGDPITLTITLIDRSTAAPAPNRLDVIQPPPLDIVEELAANFRMPGDPLAGTVRGTTKVFTQTVRATSTEVTRIPPIPFVFFDPDAEQYVTRSSNPIPITVRPASHVSMSDIVQATAPTAPAGATELREVSGGLVANYVEADLLLASQQFRLTWWWIALLAAPPALFFGTTAIRMAGALVHRDGSGRRRRSAARRAILRLNEARRLSAPQQAHAVLATASSFLADRLNLSSASMTSEEFAEILRHHGVNERIISEARQLLEECEQAMYAGGTAAGTGDDIVSRATSCIKRLERSGV